MATGCMAHHFAGAKDKPPAVRPGACGSGGSLYGLGTTSLSWIWSMANRPSESVTFS